MTGLSVDTLRAWERRYHVVKPARTSRGRLYDDADVQRFLRLHRALTKGYAIGEVSALPDAELDALLNRAEKTATPEWASDTGLDAIFAAVEAFDSARLNAELGRLAALLNPPEFVHQVALPVMRAVGERWHAGTLQTAQEHLVSDSIRNLLGAMARLNRPQEAQPKLLATTPADELHELGVLAGAVLAGARGFEVACLGPNLPASEILFAVERFAPQILLMGIVSPAPLPAAIETVREVAAALPASTEFWLGGRGARTVLDAMNSDGSDIVCLEDLPSMERLLEDRRRGGRS